MADTSLLGFKENHLKEFDFCLKVMYLPLLDSFWLPEKVVRIAIYDMNFGVIDHSQLICVLKTSKMHQNKEFLKQSPLSSFLVQL